MTQEEATAAARKGLRLELAPVGYQSRVWVDGQEISRFVTRARIEAAAAELTRVTLDCIDPGQEHPAPYTVAGRLVPDSGYAVLARRDVERVLGCMTHDGLCAALVTLPCNCGYDDLVTMLGQALAEAAP